MSQEKKCVSLDLTIVPQSKALQALFCPKCGSQLESTSRGLYCQKGKMYLSQFLEKRFLVCFVLAITNPREFELKFKPGGNWFCPWCGILAEVSNGFVKCPKCHSSLNEFIYPLIELHPHA